jgi:hypothetical protein
MMLTVDINQNLNQSLDQNQSLNSHKRIRILVKADQYLTFLQQTCIQESNEI